MSNYIKTIVSDARGIAGTCGYWIALRWMCCILMNPLRMLKGAKPSTRRPADGEWTV